MDPQVPDNENYIVHPLFSLVSHKFTITCRYRVRNIDETLFDQAQQDIEDMCVEVVRILKTVYDPQSGSATFFTAQYNWRNADNLAGTKQELIRVLDFTLSEIQSQSDEVFRGNTGVLTFSTISSVGTVTLDSGAAGSVDSITVNSVTITSGATPFNTSLTQTALDVANDITTNTSSPNYTAYHQGTVIYIIADATGTGPNGFTVTSNTTTISSTDSNMAGGATSYIYTEASEVRIREGTSVTEALGKDKINGARVPKLGAGRFRGTFNAVIFAKKSDIGNTAEKLNRIYLLQANGQHVEATFLHDTTNTEGSPVTLSQTSYVKVTSMMKVATTNDLVSFNVEGRLIKPSTFAVA